MNEYGNPIEGLVRRIQRLQAKPNYVWTKVHDSRLKEILSVSLLERMRPMLAHRVFGEKDALYIHLLLDREFKAIHERARTARGTADGSSN